MKGYAHYGFPESHAASFAHIAYTSAYLKKHHPAEFLCALINSQPMGFYAIDTLINEAKRNGVIVRPIHPNLSDWDAKMEGSRTVRMGFRNVRQIRQSDIQWMSAGNERELQEKDYSTKISAAELNSHFQSIEVERKKAPFSGLQDFMHRTRFSRNVIELMAMANVFAEFGQDQRHTLWESLKVQSLLGKKSKSCPAQLSLFTKDSATNFKNDLFKEMTLFEEISADYKALGYSIHGNAMAALRKTCPSLPKLNSAQTKTLRHGQPTEFAGILTVLQRPPTAKGVAFLTLEDEVGSLDFILKKETYERFEGVIRNHRFLNIQGKIQRTGTGISILVQKVLSFRANNSDQISQTNRRRTKSISTGSTNRNFGSPLS